jgi:hypothetical protein
MPSLLLAVLALGTLAFQAGNPPFRNQNAPMPPDDTCRPADGPALSFAGYEWQVKDGVHGPGPNAWSPRNACVDAQGRLHLWITRAGDLWHCAEVYTTAPLGPGTYRFEVIGALDRLDPNVVLGLFTYPAEPGPDATREVDIEFARWGTPGGPYGHYVTYPLAPGAAPLATAFTEPLEGTHTAHVLKRAPGFVSFQSFHGHRPDAPAFAAGPVVVTDTRYVTDAPLRVHFNLWLFQARPPADGQEVEVIVSDFRYHPLGAAP